MLTARMRRRLILASSLPVAAAAVIGTAHPAGASAAPVAPAAPALPFENPVSAFTGSMPGCIVQGALMYPLFIGMVMIWNPSSLTTALPEYWTGGDHGSGLLKKCGI